MKIPEGGRPFQPWSAFVEPGDRRARRPALRYRTLNRCRVIRASIPPSLFSAAPFPVAGPASIPGIRDDSEDYEAPVGSEALAIGLNFRVLQVPRDQAYGIFFAPVLLKPFAIYHASESSGQRFLLL